MQSSGGVLSAEAALDRPAQIVECGPAAGVIGARHLGRQLGYDNIITFDMGGTTAKASLIERGRLCTSEQYEVGSAMSATSPLMGGAGYALKLPVIDVSEVGAGGGSIVRVDSGGALKVGPESAGADPGPGLLRPRRQASRPSPTPTSSSATSTRRRSPAAPCRSTPQAARRADRRRIAAPLGRDLVETAYGIHLVANTNMMRAVKAVTTNRGRDTRDFVMFAFGGSGGVHAASLARELRIARIVVPPAAGVFSALGLLFADLELNESRACLRRLAALSQDEMDRSLRRPRRGHRRAPRPAPAPRSRFQRLADLRYAGQAFEITVPLPDGALRRARRARSSHAASTPSTRCATATPSRASMRTRWSTCASSAASRRRARAASPRSIAPSSAAEERAAGLFRSCRRHAAHARHFQEPARRERRARDRW